MTPEAQTYEVLDNGGRPFRVIITNEDTISVHCQLADYETYEEQPSMTVRGKAFVGLSPLNEMTRRSGGHGPDFDGNTIIVHTGELEYIYIGEMIFKFKSLAPITKYTSPVGNNEVPYPSAVDSEGRVYLMLEGVILNNPGDDALEGPYEEYWNRQRSGRGFEKMTIESTVCKRFSTAFAL